MSPRRTGPGSLGQNFLVDPNIIDVIARLADLAPEDVVLEVGGGEGILTRRLVAEAAWVHLIEIDPRLELGLRIALGGRGTLHLADAVSFDLGALDPAPTAMVANLPYSVAATVVLNTIFATGIARWVVMVQREVGERFAARVGSPAYGVPSVLAQLHCDVRVLRPISRQVFRPVPNVDSVLLGLTRRPDADGGEPGPSGVRRLVHDAFAHRRKAMARSISLARGGSPEVRDAVRAAVVDLGFPEDVRAERLAPADFTALAARLDGTGR
ncbi:MAG TPA: 16S rRNA (adenine(1518)-N(6)/adenine(1519)-N(6))-dimethyltransferase RsmA [Solirubrobacteraceae bacterium]|nr:16S rRNA (adenine(1518)-N(6)/adenine(1519)-N(6))-dimethyltransferase RsmA [Solirubrobacteraceae bacterium]